MSERDLALFTQVVRTLTKLGFRVGVIYPAGTGTRDVVRAIAFAHNTQDLNALVNGYIADDDTTKFFEREEPQ